VSLLPLQIVVEVAEAVIAGEGLTFIVNVIGVPEHPFAVGVTVTVATIGVVPALVPV
jgi:hypothetical protein